MTQSFTLLGRDARHKARQVSVANLASNLESLARRNASLEAM